ncbi:MAG: DUF4153 domain-containing protein [Bacteroidaceae bacterium]|nr:DUF4153 domain-containing protein [Bacteroidaceae bacterium]
MNRIQKNLRFVTTALHTCAKRFPAPMAFATALALFLIYTIVASDQIKPYEQLIKALGYFLSVGLLLSLTLALWMEEKEENRRTDTIQIVSYAILFADTIYLYSINFGSGNGVEVFLMHASAIFALVLSIFFLSFRRERDDIASWNFTLRILINLVVCFLIGFVLWGGISILLVSLDWLFNVKLEWEWYAVMGTLCAFYLPTLLFLGRIPKDEEKHQREPLPSAFLGNVMRYIFVPLEGLFLVVLYAYAIRILFQWELPNGHVSWLVIISMIGCIAIEFGLYPVRKREGRKYDENVARYLPLLLIPLIVLMSIGIIRRLSDYGITISRLYLVLLNLWFYAVCITLYLTRARRINWISISFAALFLLTSALPYNFTNFTRRQLMREVRQMLVNNKVVTPLNADSYDKLMKSLSKDEASTISAKLSYLESTFNKASIESLVNQENEGIPFLTYVNKQEEEKKEEQFSFSNNAENKQIDIPEGYSKVEERRLSKSLERKSGFVDIPVNDNDGNCIDTLRVNLDALKKLDKKMLYAVELKTKQGNCAYYMTYFYFSEYNINLEGYLFTK